MKIGLQMYSVKEAQDRDPIGTMRAVAEMGYKYWETCEIFGSDRPHNFGLCLPVDEGRALMQELGVTIIGCHLSTSVLEDEKRLNEFLDYQAAVGCRSPGLAMDFYADVDEIKRKGEYYNRLGQMCRDRGMVFHYHNHFHEFQVMEGKYVVDHILENTDPDLVKFELDTYWAARGGVDPVEMIHRYSSGLYPDRLIMLHQKDIPAFLEGHINLFDGVVAPDAVIGRNEFMLYNKGFEDKCLFAEVGTGIMDIQRIIDAANAENIPYITLEQDYTTYTELESVQMSMDAFRKFTGVEWA